MLALCLLFYPIPVASYTYYRDAESCDLVGDSDVYGIGIRISIYIQSLTAIIGLFASGPEILHTLRFGFNAIATGIVFNFLKDIIQHNGFLYLEYGIVASLLEFILWIFNGISILMVGIQVMKEIREETLFFFCYEYLAWNGSLIESPASELQQDYQIPLSAPYHLFKQGNRRNSMEKFSLKFNRAIGNLGYFSIAWTLLLSSILLGTRFWLDLEGSDFGHPSHCKAMINFYGYIDIYTENWQIFHIFSSVLLYYTVFSQSLGFSIVCFTFGFSDEFKKLGIYERPAELDVLPTSTSTRAKKWPVRFFVWLKRVHGFKTDDMIPYLPYTVLFPITSLTTTFPYYILFALISLIALISGIVWTEETIRVNNIDLSAATITSSGQLMSLIVTIFSSIPIWWTMLITLMAKLKRKRTANQ